MWKGLVSGFAGGLAGSWAMGLVHGPTVKLLGGNQKQPGEDPTVKVARAVSSKIFDHRLTRSETKMAGPMVHYAFGSSVAAVYGAIAEVAPAVSAGGGIPFGVAVWLGAHVIALPALGLAPPVTRSDTPSEVAEFVAHLLYGGLTELVRSGVRSRLPG